MNQPRPTLLPIPGCGRCADLVAAHLLGCDLYDVMEEHLRDHEPAPSIHGEVNELARSVVGGLQPGDSK